MEPSPTPKSEVLWCIITMTADAVQVIYHGVAYIVSGTWRCLCLLSASAIEAAVTSVQALLGAASWCFRWLSDILETVQKTHWQWPYFVTGAVIAIVSILVVCTMVILSQVRTFMTVAYRQSVKVFVTRGKIPTSARIRYRVNLFACNVQQNDSFAGFLIINALFVSAHLNNYRIGTNIASTS